MANMEKLERDYGEILWTGKKCIMGMPISFTRYIITSSVLYTKVGFLNIKEDEIELYKIVDKTMKLSLGQRMVGCGTIVVTSRDCDTPNKELKSVKKPREVKKILDEPENVTITEFDKVTKSDRGITFTLPPCSVAEIILS